MSFNIPNSDEIDEIATQLVWQKRQARGSLSTKIYCLQMAFIIRHYRTQTCSWEHDIQHIPRLCCAILAPCPHQHSMSAKNWLYLWDWMKSAFPPLHEISYPSHFPCNRELLLEGTLVELAILGRIGAKLEWEDEILAGTQRLPHLLCVVSHFEVSKSIHTLWDVLGQCIVNTLYIWL